MKRNKIRRKTMTNGKRKRKSKPKIYTCANCGAETEKAWEHDYSSVDPLCEDCYDVVCELWGDIIDDYIANKNYYFLRIEK